MLFDIGPGEFLVIAVVGLLIVGPDRLPKMFAEAVKWLRFLRDQAAGARREIIAAADIDPGITDELRRSVSDIAELHPKRLMGSILSDDAITSAPTPPPPPPPPPAPVNSFGASATSSSFAPRPADAPVAPAQEPAAFDPDAT
ncbi:MAG TPA: twin-arginine translocase TatA/TatE family subunit [Candidatus Nanopelagicales bacterium]